MLRFCLTALALLGTAGLGFAQQPHPYAETLNEKSLTWLRANNAFGPNSDLVSDLGGEIKKTLGVEKGKRSGKNFTLTLGPKVTKSGKATILATWSRELFVFELTEEQFKKTKVNPSGAGFSPGWTPEPLEEATNPPPIEIGEPKLKGGAKVDGSKKLAGEIELNVLEEVTEPMELRIAYAAAGANIMKTFKLDPQLLPLTGKGKVKIPFSVVGINEGVAKKADGPVLLIFDVYIPENLKKLAHATAVCKPKAVLIDVQ